MFVKLAYKLLKLVLSRDLSLAERNLFTELVLDRLDALPLHDIITVGDEGELLINGSVVDLEKARDLHVLANAALDNKAEKLIDEQVMWAAMVNGLHKGDTPEKLYFYRAAIWFGQQRENLLRLLAQREQEPPLQ